ncbi:BON domain-containing protein [Roseomonas rosea]|uniref:BON domain-containing protein n=1 Tax=Muricoccus roseus TaxID=198092 RepID=A0A1M6RE37_9PROT|nr:CBS domain-containing protein [Roseomonas rosea]SHK30628.1 BON domain-containing protein [Roseomonas rosea]
MTSKTPTARDLMTPDVLSVPPDMPVAVLARMLAERHLSAVPVTDTHGHVLGIVSEADLLRRLAGEEDLPRGWLAQLISNPSREAGRYARTHGRRVSEVMTPDVVAVEEDATAAHVAHLLEEKHIKRVPVLRKGRLVGIVSRADLLRAVLDMPPAVRGESETEDERIFRALEDERARQPWSDTAFVFAHVENGIVRLYGLVRSEEIRKAMVVLAERIEGVKEVKDEMSIQGGVLMPGL